MKVFSKKSKRFWHVAPFFLPFVFWGCAPDYGNLLTSPAGLPPLIFAFLNTAADSQYVILRNSVTAQGKDDVRMLEPEFQRLRQAKVTLAGGGEDFVIHDKYELKDHELDAAIELVFVSANPVHPGETYRLRVEIPEKGVYTASTTAPGDFQILAPNPHDTLDVFNPLTVKWTAAQGAYGYRVTLQWTLLDSTRFKYGKSDTIDKVKERIFKYVEPSADLKTVLKHRLDLYYTLPEALFSKPLAKDTPVLIFVEALDAPVWLAHEINQRELNYGDEEEVRLMPGVYSNIEGGRGLMTATTTKTIPITLPPQKK